MSVILRFMIMYTTQVPGYYCPTKSCPRGLAQASWCCWSRLSASRVAWHAVTQRARTVTAALAAHTARL
jgi:hypothetical protein